MWTQSLFGEWIRQNKEKDNTPTLVAPRRPCHSKKNLPLEENNERSNALPGLKNYSDSIKATFAAEKLHAI